MKHPRIAIGALTFSAAAFVGLAAHEGYTDRAVIPVAGDRPTVGMGSTFRDDGTPVQMGDRITPPQAIARSVAHIAKDEGRLKQCVTAPLHQAEYDLLVDFAYQYGTTAACKSSMVKLTNQGQYAAACDGYGRYRFVGKPPRDCAIRANGCYGVYTRAMERVQKCKAAQ